MKKLIAAMMALSLVCSLATTTVFAETYSEETNKVTISGSKAANKSGQGVVADNNVFTDAEVAVKITRNESSGTTHVYAVAYSTTELTFNYSGDLIWNPETQSYDLVQDETNRGGSWSDAQPITVTNYSDLAISVTATASSDKDDIAVKVGEDATSATGNSYGFTVASAVSTEEAKIDSSTTGTAQTGTVYVAVSGDPAGLENDAKVGTITLTIGKVAS